MDHGHNSSHMAPTVMPGHDGHTTMTDHGNHGGMGHGNQGRMGVTEHGHHATMGGMDHGNHGGMGGMDHMMMHMFFNTNYPVHVLFARWLVQTPGQMAGACIGVFIISILYEGLKVFRAYLLARSNPKRCYEENSNDSKAGSTDVMFSVNAGSAASSLCSGCHIFQSVLQVIQTTLGMFLMLIYMTFNVWLALCVSLGSGFGYYFFGWMQRRHVSIGDHCN